MQVAIFNLETQVQTFKFEMKEGKLDTQFSTPLQLTL